MSGRRGLGPPDFFGGKGEDADLDLDRHLGGPPRHRTVLHVPHRAPSLGALQLMRDRPSRLLAARHQVVPFAGRDRELKELTAWRDSRPARAALLLHARGGQGKSRLAERIAVEAAESGWRVARAHHVGEPTDPGDREPGDLFVLVDNADHWPLTELVRLLHRHSRCGGRLRLLLLARTQGWWPAFARELARAGAAAEAVPLSPLASDVDARAEHFATAVARFAAVYETGVPADAHPPGGVGDRAYELTFALHAAALCVVDAASRRVRGPRHPADLSEYLIDREREHWRRLFGAERVPDVSRIAFTAAVTGPLSMDETIERLAATGLPELHRLIAEHTRCYPPSRPGTALEPVHPERLAEDLLALSIPGHPMGHADIFIPGLLSFPGEAGARRLGPLFRRDETGGAPRHAARGIIALSAAASRWPHVISALRRLVRADPALIADAGAAALTAVLDHLDADTALALVTATAANTDPDLAAATAALTRRAVALHPKGSVRLELLTPAVERHRAVRAWAEVEQYARDLIAHGEDAPGHDLALSRLAECHARRGERGEACALLERAAEGHRIRAVAGDPEAALRLAEAITGLSLVLDGSGNGYDALRLQRHALAGLRDRRGGDPDERARLTVGILLVHAETLRDNGQSFRAAHTALSALEIARRHDPGAGERLAGVLARVGEHLPGRPGVAAKREAVAILRGLGAAHRVRLGVESGALATAVDDPAEAVALSREALALLEEATSDRELLAGERSRLGGLLSTVGEHAESLRLSGEAVDAWLEIDRPSRPLELARALKVFADVRLAAGREAAEALEAAEWAVRIRECEPTGRRHDRVALAETHAAALDTVGREQDAAAVRRRHRRTAGGSLFHRLWAPVRHLRRRSVVARAAKAGL
ncbi:hypothetical protein AB0I28_22765 [Phytomonospora sp. NPDC050363]|uniref:hypothetical protein n=1 Tax=Phytomonospora sp. NPDC050363 TaxID=3155642 RepID=UPI0033F94A65